MTQQEKDKLIEKFMGWELKWLETTPQMYYGWTFINKFTDERIEHQYNTSVVGFTTNLNRLWEALYKFDNLPMHNSRNSEFMEYSKKCAQIDYDVTLYNIDDAVNALCEGIEWYNSTLN